MLVAVPEDMSVDEVAGASAPYRWVGIARQDCSYEPEPLQPWFPLATDLGLDDEVTTWMVDVYPICGLPRVLGSTPLEFESLLFILGTGTCYESWLLDHLKVA